MNWYKKARKGMPGGLADKKKPSDFDSKQIEKGVKVEMEHTDDPEIAAKIALDHLVENIRYYEYLAEMHERMEEDFSG